MPVAGLDRSSIRDVSVNLVLVSILAFFSIWFVVDAPWGWDPLAVVVIYGLIGHLVVLLLGVTYPLARRIQAIEGDER